MENEGFTASYNTSSGVVFELSRLRTLANSYFSLSKIERATQFLISMKQTASSVLDKNEIEELRKLEMRLLKIQAKKSKLNPKGFKSPSNDYMKLMDEEFILYDEYSFLLNRCLQKHGLLLIEKGDITKMAV